MYRDQANEHQMKLWSENFLWFFVNWAFRKIRYLKTDEELSIARQNFMDLYKLGVFDTVPKSRQSLREKIFRFIGM